jgi:hypothetical protein
MPSLFNALSPIHAVVSRISKADQFFTAQDDAVRRSGLTKPYIRDGLRGRPENDLSSYAAARGLDHRGAKAQLGYLLATCPFHEQLLVDVVRGVLPGGEAGVIAHEARAYEEGTRGLFYGTKTLTAGEGIWSDLKPSWGDLNPITGGSLQYFKVPCCPRARTCASGSSAASPVRRLAIAPWGRFAGTRRRDRAACASAGAWAARRSVPVDTGRCSRPAMPPATARPRTASASGSCAAESYRSPAS